MSEKASHIFDHCDELLESVKTDEARLQEIAVLKKHIINYAKAKDVFAEYKASGYSQKFFEEHRELLTLRRAAKQAFDVYKAKNGADAAIPRVKELSQEYAVTLERKKKTYAEYRKTKAETQERLVAQKIVQTILGEEQKKQDEHEQEVWQDPASHENDR